MFAVWCDAFLFYVGIRLSCLRYDVMLLLHVGIRLLCLRYGLMLFNFMLVI